MSRTHISNETYANACKNLFLLVIPVPGFSISQGLKTGI